MTEKKGMRERERDGEMKMGRGGNERERAIQGQRKFEEKERGSDKNIK